MPKEYEHCKESYLKKGVPEKKAKAICAGMYYNRHGITVNEAHKRGLKGMLYFARTKEALKSILLANKNELGDFVIVKIPQELRKNEVVKSLYPKVENTEYVYVAVHKSAVDVTVEGKVVLVIEKLVSGVKENETSKQNENNVAHVEAGEEVVKQGKLEKSSGEKSQHGTLTEQLQESPKTKSVNSVEQDTHEEQEQKLPTLSEVMSKVARGEKLNAIERHILSVALDAVRSSKHTTKEEREKAREDLEKGNVSESTKETLEKEFGHHVNNLNDEEHNYRENKQSEEEHKNEKKHEGKTLTSTSPTAESLEREDLEEEVVPVTKSLFENLLVSNKSLSTKEPVFDSKADANRFARLYNVRVGDKRAIVVPASLREQKLYGNRAKYVVVFED